MNRHDMSAHFYRRMVSSRRILLNFVLAACALLLVYLLSLFAPDVLAQGSPGFSQSSNLANSERIPSSYSTLLGGERGLDGVLFLASLAIHQPHAHVYISSDSHTYEWFLEHARVLFHRLNLHWTLALDKHQSASSRAEMEAAKTWANFMLEKVAIMETALTHHNDTMLLDADFVVLEPIHLPTDAQYQLGVSPHYIKACKGKMYGVYNGGMLWTNQMSLGAAWRNATTSSRYFEQAAIEDLVRSYTPHFEFGPEHNVGFWRVVHDEVSPEEFYSHLYYDASAQKIMLKNQTVATFHTHILTRYPYAVGNDFSSNLVKMMRMSSDPNYVQLMRAVQWGQSGHVPPQMVL